MICKYVCVGGEQKSFKRKFENEISISKKEEEEEEKWIEKKNPVPVWESMETYKILREKRRKKTL